MSAPIIGRIGPPPEDEEEWMGWVTDYATRVARPPWLVYHTRNSKGSHPGFPDLVLLRPPRMVVAELKVHPASQRRGKPTPAQSEWLDAFAAVGMTGGMWDDATPSELRAARMMGAGDVVETYVWRPPDRPEIAGILT